MTFGRLIIEGPAGRRQELPLSAAGVRIGSALDNDLVIGGAGIAAHHAVISCDGDSCQIVDVGSAEGTLLDGERLLVNIPQELEPGALARLGAWTITYQPGKGGSPGQTGSLPARAMGGPRQTQPLQLSDDDFLLSVLNAPPKKAPAPQPAPDEEELLRVLLVTEQAAQPEPPPPPTPDIVPTTPIASVEAPAPPPAPLLLSLSQHEAQVVPGDTATIVVAVANRGTLVDKVELAIEGIPVGGYTFTPSELSLFPGAQGEAQLTLHPPRGHIAHAGVYPVRVIARSQQGAPAVAEAALEVLPFYQYTLSLAPQVRTAAFGAPYQLTIANDSNADLPITLVGVDPENTLRFHFPRPQVVAPPGTDLVVPVRISLAFMQLIGQDRAYPFTITATPTFDATLAQGVSGQLVRHPPLPPALMRLLLLLMLGLLACAGLAFGSAFLCGPAPEGLPPREAILARLFPVCRNTVSATAPTIVPVLGEALEVAAAEAQSSANQQIAETAAVAAAQSQTEAEQAAQAAAAATAQAIAQTQQAILDAEAARAQTAAAELAAQTATALANENSATQTAAALTATAGALLPTSEILPLPLITITSIPLPIATETPLPTATETPLPTTTETPLPTATETPLPSPTSTSAPTPTATPPPTATPTPTSTPTPTPRGPAYTITFDSASPGPITGSEFTAQNAFFCIYMRVSEGSTPSSGPCVLPSTYRPFDDYSVQRQASGGSAMIYGPSGNRRANALAATDELDRPQGTDSIILINFPNQDVYEVRVTVYHTQSRGGANYQLLAYDGDRVLIGSSSSDNASIEGSRQITFYSASRPIRVVVLEDNNQLEIANTSFCDGGIGINARQYVEGCNNPLLLERVELFTTP